MRRPPSPGQLRALLSSGVHKKSRPPPPPPPSSLRPAESSAARSATLVANAASSSAAPPPPSLQRKTPPPPPRPPSSPPSSLEQTLTGIAPPSPSSITAAASEPDAPVDGIDLNWDESDDEPPADTSAKNLELKGPAKDTEPDLTPSDGAQAAAPALPAVSDASAPALAGIFTPTFPPAADDDDDDDDDDDALTRALPSPDPLEAATVPLPSVREIAPPPSRGAVGSQPRPVPSSRLPALPALPALVSSSRRPLEPPVSRSVTGPLPPPSMPAGSAAPLPSFSVPSAPAHAAPASIEPFTVPSQPLLESLLRGPKRTFVLAALGTVVALLALITLLVAIPTGKQGALVITVSGPGNALVRKLSVNLDDATRCSSSPCRIEQLPTGTHFIQVSSPDHEPMATRAVQVEPNGETVLHVELMPLRAPAAESTTVASKAAASPAVDFDADAPAERARTASRSAPAAVAVRSAPAKPQQARLTVNSIPPSSVVIDGQPLGKTPQTKSVAPGSHSIVFIHPTLGRRVQSAQVAPGGNKTVVARFK